MSLGVKAFHIAVLGFYIRVSHYQVVSAFDNKLANEPHVKVMGELSPRFLTNWTYAVQFIYFTCCVLAHFLDIIPSLHKLRDKVNYFGNGLFTTLAAPMAFFVTCSFWLLYTIDRELVFPKWLDEVMPTWINHSIHSLNSVFPILDMCLVNHKYPSWRVAITVISLYLFAYGICLYGTYFQTGIWLYPFLKNLTWFQRGAMTIVDTLIIIILYGVGKLISRLFWGADAVTSTKSSKTKKSNNRKTRQKAA